MLSCQTRNEGQKRETLTIVRLATYTPIYIELLLGVYQGCETVRRTLPIFSWWQSP